MSLFQVTAIGLLASPYLLLLITAAKRSENDEMAELKRRVKKIEDCGDVIGVSITGAPEVVGRPAGRYTRVITTNARGRCAICDKVADHVHSEGTEQ